MNVSVGKDQIVEAAKTLKLPRHPSIMDMCHLKVLRECPEELMRVLSLTPYSREEYDESFVQCDDPIERARRFMVKTTQAIGAKMDGKCGWRNHKQMKIGGTACKWGGITDTVGAAAMRLRGDTTHLVRSST